MPLTPRVFKLLATLVDHRGELLDKEHLMREVWDGAAVEDNNLTRQICTLRKALQEHPGRSEFILTVPGVGYRFVAPVREVDSPNIVAAPRRFAWAAALVAAGVLVVGGAILAKLHAGKPAAENAVPHVLRQVTFGRGLEQDPAWSPDGRKVAYASDRSGNSNIWIQDVDDGELVRLTTAPTRDWQPSWSPDGRSIVCN